MLGEKKIFNESNPLIDSEPLRLVLSEDSGDSKYLIARGEFGRADIPTQNRRIYPRKIWEREINKAMKAIKQGKVLGMLEHPKDGKTTLEKVSHMITNLEMLDDGRIMGEAKILKNQYGGQVESIFRAGGSVGVSSRGLGSTVENREGYDVVQEDFSYITHDFVVDPAVTTSYPDFIEEQNEGATSSFEQTLNEGDDDMTKKQETEKSKEILSEDKVKEIVSAELKVLMDGFKSEVIQKLAQLKESQEEEGKKEPGEEVISQGGEANPQDPVSAPAANKLDASPEAAPVVVAEPAADAEKETVVVCTPVEVKKDGEDAAKVDVKDEPAKEDAAVQESVEKKLEKAVMLSESLAMQLEYQKALVESSYPSVVKGLIGDISGYKKLHHLQDALTKAEGQALAKRKEESVRIAERKKLLERKEAQIKKLVAEKDQLKSALEEATKAAKEYALKLYVESKIRLNPNADKVRKLVESKNLRTKQECDLLIESFSIATPEAEDYNSIRRRFKVPATLVESHIEETGIKVSFQEKTVVEGVDRELDQLMPGQLGEIKSLAEAVGGR